MGPTTPKVKNRAPTAGLRNGGGRSFDFLGPDRATLGVDMSASVRLDSGERLRVWGFTPGFQGRPVPAGVIEAIEGRLLEVTLHSHLPHSLHLHGLDADQANDGVPSTSGFVSRMGGMGGGMGGTVGFGRVDGYRNLGSPFTYRVRTRHAGTYFYHCHVDTSLHLEMGMYGALVVRPPDGELHRLWHGGPAFDREWVWVLSTFDRRWHAESVSGPGTARYRPDVFMLNGLDGEGAADDPATALVGVPGERLVVRCINAGYQPARVCLGGLPFEVLASDGRPLQTPVVVEEWAVYPGERFDLRLTVTAPVRTTATVEYFDSRLRSVIGLAATRIDLT